LKVFALGAILILIVQVLVSASQTWPSKTISTSSADSSGQPVDITRLLAEAHVHPSVELFIQISQHYEKIGKYRRAMFYLREADRAEDL
jgi:hypothetical protein